MGEGPKLYTNKPKKSQLKPHQRDQGSLSSSSSMASSGTTPPPQPPPPQPPRERFARRYKFLWPMLLAVNFAIGAYLFMRTKKKDTDVEEGEVPGVAPTSGPTTAEVVPASEKTVLPPPIIEPKLREPIPENQQRELFKWLLEEKRKVKPKDSEEKKRIDEEKALLKQFIRAKSIPSL